MLRRLWFSALLSLCLLFSQQAALLHELGHWGAGSGTVQTGASAERAATQAAPHATAATELCGTCLAYAQMASGLPTPWHALDLRTQRPIVFAAIFFIAYSAPAPPASIRGPPVFL